MGMFTTIIHPEDSRELQIKCGFDDCEIYSLGEEVWWEIWPDKPGRGKLLDGVYTSHSDRGDDDFVLIKNHRVVGIMPKVESPKGVYNRACTLATLFGITPYERNWWTESAWAKEELRQVALEIESLQEKAKLLEACIGKSDEDIVKLREEHRAELLIKPILTVIGYESLTRQMFPIKEQS
jgi:hypothetical protein